jgi:hypothetical protein
MRIHRQVPETVAAARFVVLVSTGVYAPLSMIGSPATRSSSPAINVPATVPTLRVDPFPRPREVRWATLVLVAPAASARPAAVIAIEVTGPVPTERPGFVTQVRKLLAYRALEGDTTLSLTADQRKQIKDGLKHREGDLGESVRRLYRQLYLPARTGWKEFDLGIPTVGDTKTLDQDVYDRMRMEGEELEKIVALVIKEKYLKDRDTLSTAQLYQASLKTPGETRAINQNAWDTGIADGVRHGIFGMGELQDGQPICRYFKEECSVSFSDSEILIRAEICEEQRRQEREQELARYTSVDPVTPTPPVSEGSGQTTFTPGGSTPPAGQYKQMNFNFVIPKGKVSGLMGVLNYLQSKYETMTISLKLENGQMTEQELEDKVKEAFRQMGIKVD